MPQKIVDAPRTPFYARDTGEHVGDIVHFGPTAGDTQWVRDVAKLWLSCPFCGPQKLATLVVLSDAPRANGSAPLFWTECSRCNARGPLVPTEAEAITVWNHRSVTSDLNVERIYGPAILKDGELYVMRTPASHFGVAKMMERDGRKEPLKGAQGFYSTRSGFVGRREARRIADAAGQIVNPISGSNDLFSEELWRPAHDLNAVAEEEISGEFHEIRTPSGRCDAIAEILRRHFGAHYQPTEQEP